ncbi:hypothetical protein TSAR_012134 [Trichomalopsis sarcophagae]|uniref:Uncharacterized protein n=1 Tax=Trichomalopsis sarcophagae TaxID=543379 RepID=A0A232EMH6_9HYME|nr:hypothetical protein TSAR_012134 [Trichomalopsis sarcophagae]
MISTYPLIVMYWTEEQIKLWNEANELDEVDISIDASGSFIKRVKIVQDNYSSDLFLYVIVVRFGGKIFPVAQMISESHNTNTITLFMMTTKVYGAPSPKIILADCSVAHMKPKRFKVEEAKKFMDNSDIIPSLLSNSVVYKTARQEIRDQDLKLENYPGNPIESLHEMMDDISAVKMISTYPLIVMYWTEEQIKLWNEANELDEVDISIDASGSFILDKMLKHDLYYGQKLIICSFNQISDPKYPTAKL